MYGLSTKKFMDWSLRQWIDNSLLNKNSNIKNKFEKNHDHFIYNISLSAFTSYRSETQSSHFMAKWLMNKTENTKAKKKKNELRKVG